jgi:hypothetical protein
MRLETMTLQETARMVLKTNHKSQTRAWRCHPFEMRVARKQVFQTLTVIGNIENNAKIVSHCRIMLIDKPASAKAKAVTGKLAVTKIATNAKPKLGRKARPSQAQRA